MPLRPALVLIALAWALPLPAQQTTHAAGFAGLARYREDNAKLPPPEPGRVVFMGNSITQGWAPLFPTLFAGKPYIGRGISGQTTAQMLLRFRQDVIALRPAAVVILAGTNDIAGNTGPATIAEIQDNIAAMAELARVNGIRVVLGSVLPVFDYPWKPGLEPAPKIMALNAWMKTYAAAHDAVYVDFHSAMQDERHGMKRELSYDGVHATEAGYRVMATLVEPGIAAALASRTTQPSQPPQPQPFFVGNRLGLPINPAADGAFEAMSPNVKVFGSVYSAESCSYDAGRGLIVVPSRGVPQGVQANNAWVSLVNHDGSVHTARWIGVQVPAQRASLTPPLVLNEPFGSDIAAGKLYVADRDGGTGPADPSVAVVRRFDLRTGAPAGQVRVAASTGFNDIEVAEDGTIYATQTGDFGARPDSSTWQLWKITPDGTASVLVRGAPLAAPNGVALDPQGNVVVVNVGNADVLTFSPAGRLLRTETAAQPGSDGLVILRDGTKYVSSVIHGGVSRIRPGRPAELIARNIPNAASMCYDAGANQLVIPMNANNALAFVRLP